MIELYAAATPNGKKIPIALEELGLAYELHKIDFSKNEQKSEAFLAINPNGKIPAMIDRGGPEPIRLFESGAILEYLARKAGKLLPTDPQKRADAMSWLFWQVGGPGPMFGQAGAFARQDPKNEQASEKFLKESQRLTAVLEGHLANREWIAGEYSIADIANFPWFEGMTKFLPAVVENAPNVHAWIGRMRERPAVTKAMALFDAK